MTHSLNFRLLAAFTLVIIVIIGTVFFFTYQTTRGEISQIGERLQTAQDQTGGNRTGALLSVHRDMGRSPATGRGSGAIFTMSRIILDR